MLEIKILLYADLFPGPLNIGIYRKARDNKNLGFKSNKYKRLLNRQA